MFRTAFCATFMHVMFCKISSAEVSAELREVDGKCRPGLTLAWSATPVAPFWHRRETRSVQMFRGHGWSPPLSPPPTASHAAAAPSRPPLCRVKACHLHIPTDTSVNPPSMATAQHGTQWWLLLLLLLLAASVAAQDILEPLRVAKDAPPPIGGDEPPIGDTAPPVVGDELDDFCGNSTDDSGEAGAWEWLPEVGGASRGGGLAVLDLDCLQVHPPCYLPEPPAQAPNPYPPACPKHRLSRAFPTCRPRSSTPPWHSLVSSTWCCPTAPLAPPWMPPSPGAMAQQARWKRPATAAARAAGRRLHGCPAAPMTCWWTPRAATRCANSGRRRTAPAEACAGSRHVSLHAALCSAPCKSTPHTYPPTCSPPHPCGAGRARRRPLLAAP